MRMTRLSIVAGGRTKYTGSAGPDQRTRARFRLRKDHMSERYDGEEEPRRRSRRRRSSDPSADDEVRRRGDPSFDEERHGEGAARVRRSGRRAGGLSGSFDWVAGRLVGRGSGRWRGGGISLQQMRGLYGSDTGSSVVGSAIAELIGTFILVFTGCAVAVAAILQRSTAGPAFYDSLAVALAFGLALAAIVAAIAVWVCYGEAAREAAALAATFPTEGVGDIRALLAEILVTFILVFVIISVATDERAPAGVAPLAVGFALACGVFIAGPITGGSLNPARTLGPMVVAGQFSAAWVYVVGPIVGAVLAAVVYDRFVSQADATQ